MNNQQDWEFKNLINNEQLEFHENGLSRPKKERRKEFQYYTDFVKHQTMGINIDKTISLLAMSGSTHRLVEIVMTKPHDIDAKNLVAAELLFFLFNFADRSGFHIENIERSGNFESINNKVANLSNAMKDMVMYHTVNLNIDWPDNHEVQNYAQDIACKTIELVNARNLHALLKLNIQKNALNDDMMDARFKHIIAKPFMKTELECHSIYPIIYTIPATATALFLSLLENSGIKNNMQYLLLDDVVTKIQEYMIKFMAKEKMTLERVNNFLTEVINGIPGTIDIRDKNSLIWPISNCLKMTTFEFNWNNKYPGKFPLVSIDDNSTNRKELIAHRTGNISSLPFKKRWLDTPTYQTNVQNELQLLTEEDIKWLESLSKTPECPPIWPPTWPHEVFDEFLKETPVKDEKQNG
jgi:hypothetical protein